MVMENHAQQMFFYAMGEIVLIVIGILIAISINNWNNNLNDAAKETKILLQLKEGLTEDKNKMQADLKNVVQIQKLLKRWTSFWKIQITNTVLS